MNSLDPANVADALPDILHRGVIPDIVTDQTSAHHAHSGDIPVGTSLAHATSWRTRTPHAYVEGSIASRRDGNTIRAQATRARRDNAFDIPGDVTEDVRPRDTCATDDTVLQMFPDTAMPGRLMPIDRARIAFQGSPAGIWSFDGEARATFRDEVAA